MRTQNGSIVIDRGSWALRWRETLKGQSVKRSKVLGPVLPEHARNKDRATGKLRIPREIQAEADKILSTVNRAGASVSTIAEFVDGVFLKEKKQSLKPGSYEALNNRWTCYLKHRIGDEVLRDFERKHAAALWQELRNDLPHLSSQTFRHIRFCLRGIYETAKDKGLYFSENPATASLPPNLPGRKETKAHTIEEVARMLNLFTANPQAQAIIALAFGSGMRKGELAALAWQDYEPSSDGAIIHVRRSSWRGKILTTKTTSSADETAIDSEICAYVEAYRELLHGVDEGLMFCYAKDRPINLDSFARNQIIPILAKAGIPWKGWHAFRRGNATYLAKKQDSATAALVLRHSDASTTEDHYVKQTKQDRRAAEARKVINIRSRRQQAAKTIGAGLKEVRAN